MDGVGHSPHQAHCAACFDSSCSGAECAMINCPGCDVRMHTCKLEEHRECICAMTLVDCQNAFYGCTARMRRKKMNEHIQHCPASLVLCPFIRYRQFVNKSAKKKFKRIARGQCDDGSSLGICQKFPPACNLPDIALAHTDQLTLQRAFRLPRAKRFSLILALRRRELEQLLANNNQDDANNDEEKGYKMRAIKTTVDEEDSSDEEAKINASHYRAMREPFSGCRLCAVDPGSQHLHQLGSMRRVTGENDQKQQQMEHNSGRDERRSADESPDELAFLPIFNRRNNLFISHDVNLAMPLDFSGAFKQHFMRTNFPIFACDEFVRRDHFSDHCAAHSVFEDGGLAFFARCPNAQYGCAFSTDELLKTVHGGQIKFNSFLGMGVHVPVPSLSQCPPSSAADGTPLFVQMSDHFFSLLGPFLDDASLRSLCSTCRRFRHLLPSLLRNRLSVELLWVKRIGFNIPDNFHRANFSIVTQPRTEIRYEICGKRLFFGISQFGPTAGGAAFPHLQVQPRGALVDHLRNQCKFSNQHSIYDDNWVACHKLSIQKLRLIAKVKNEE